MLKSRPRNNKKMANSENVSQTNIRKIPNPMSTKNEGEISEWYDHTERRKLEEKAGPGDLLECDRAQYKHWAVYAGPMLCPNGTLKPHVVHFDNTEPSLFRKKIAAKIFFQTLKHVVANDKVRINNGLDRRTCLLSTANSMDVINERIRQFSKEETMYHVVHSNCEHFANYCRYGGKISSQSRIIWVAISILALDAVLRGSSASTVILLRSVESMFWFGLPVFVLFALICGTFIFVMNTVVSASIKEQMVFTLGVTMFSFLIGETAWTSEVELGDGASFQGLLVGIVLFFTYYSTSQICTQFPKRVLNKLGCVSGLVFLAYVVSLKFAASLVEIIYVYETVRLAYVGSRDNLNYLTFATAVSHLSYSFGKAFPFCLVLVIIVDDTIRLFFSAYKDKLNCVAFGILTYYLFYVFEWQHAATFLSICIVVYCLRYVLSIKSRLTEMLTITLL